MPTEDLSAAQRLKETADQLFFIVGCGRSGTSLLQAMISSHPVAIIPNETKFYTVIHKHYRRMGELHNERTFDRAIHAVLDCWWIQDLNLNAEEVRALCRAGQKTWETILLALLTLYAEKHHAQRVGEKSPAHLRHLGPLQDRFPQAKFIHVMRDPRAVVLSLVKAPFATSHVGPKIQHWRLAIDTHLKYADALGPARYMLVKYEDLVRSPEAVLRCVCQFLGLAFSPQMLQHHHRPVRGFGDRQYQHMANTLRPVFTSSIGKWRQELKPSQIALIEYALADGMKLMGYEPSGARTSLPAARIAASRALDLLTRGLGKLRSRPEPLGTR